MKRFSLILSLAAMISMPAIAHAQNSFSVQGETVYTMAGEPIRDGVVLVKDGKIERVGPASSVNIPEGYRVLKAKVVTPGLIDAHSVVGLSGLLNQPQDQEQLDKSAPMQPELRAIDAYNPRDPLVDWVRGFGITTVHTGHAPGALVSGQTMIVKTYPANLDQAVISPSAMVAVTLGAGALEEKKDKPPGTTSKAVAMLRAELIKAREYQQKRAKNELDKRPARDLRLDTFVEVLEGQHPLLVTAHRHQDILSALRLASEFGLHILLDGASDAPLVLNELKQSGFPVILHPAMARAYRENENLSMETAAQLKKAGIPFAFQSGYEVYVPKTRVVLFEAAMALANGLEFRDALAAITIDAARLLGIEKRVGSLEAGKDADVALYDSDPFEYTTHCVGVVISGLALETVK